MPLGRNRNTLQILVVSGDCDRIRVSTRPSQLGWVSGPLARDAFVVVHLSGAEVTNPSIWRSRQRRAGPAGLRLL